MKSSKYEYYLNTPKNEEYSAIEDAPFSAPLVDFETEMCTSSTAVAKILQVQQASKSLSCVSCNRRTIDLIGPNQAKCSSCKLIQLPSGCNTNWVLRLLAKPQNSTKLLNLKLNHGTAQAVLKLMDPLMYLPSKTEEDIITLILQSHEKNFKFTYDTLNLQVSDVQTVDGQQSVNTT